MDGGGLAAGPTTLTYKPRQGTQGSPPRQPEALTAASKVFAGSPQWFLKRRPLSELCSGITQLGPGSHSGSLHPSAGANRGGTAARHVASVTPLPSFTRLLIFTIALELALRSA